MEHLSNEEKIKEICECSHCSLIEDVSPQQKEVTCKRCVLSHKVRKMAQWKDEQFAKEKKEIDEQWKRLMAESKSIGVDLLQCIEKQHEQEKQQWIEKALKFLDDNFEYYSGLKIECLLEDFKKAMEE